MVIKRYRPEWEEYIEGLGTFFYNVKNASIPELNDSIPKTRDLVYVISKTGRDISGPVREGIIAYPGEGNLLVREPVLQKKEWAEEAAVAHSEGREFYINKEFARSCLAKAKKYPENEEAIFLKNHFPIQTSKFAEDKRIRFLFDDMIGHIADILKAKSINAITFYADSKEDIDKHAAPYANQLWMSLFSQDMPGFLGNYKHLHIKDMIHAIEKDAPTLALSQ